MQILKWINQNSGALLVVLMAVSSIAGITAFIWTEINSLKTEVSISRTETQSLRNEVALIREDIRLLRDDIRLLQEDNRLLREEMRLLRLEIRAEIDGLEVRLRADMERNHQQLTQALIDHLHDADGSAIFKAPLDPGQ